MLYGNTQKRVKRVLTIAKKERRAVYEYQKVYAGNAAYTNGGQCSQSCC